MAPRPGPRGPRLLTHHGFAGLRTPLLPFEALEALAGPDPRAALGRLLERSEVREALYVAAPELEEQLPVWRKDPLGERGQKLERALLRYVLRMGARSTPFGLFAAFSVLREGGPAALVLPALEACRRRTRLSMDVAFAFAHGVTANPAARDRLRFRPNSALAEIEDRLRYVETQRAGLARRYQLTAVEADETVSRVLRRAEEGVRLATLAEAICAADPEIPLEDARAFLDELVEAQLLVPELLPALTGPSPVEGQITELREGGLDGEARRLEAVVGGLAALDAGGLGHSPAEYRAVAQSLEGGPVAVDADAFVQVDLARPLAGGQLPRGVLDALAATAELLLSTVAEDFAMLREFRTRFEERYETAEVPLAEALDEESGLAFPGAAVAPESPLLESMPLAGVRSPAPETVTPWERLLRDRLLLHPTGAELVLEVEELEALRSARPPHPVPDSLTIAASVLAASAEAVDRGDYQLLFKAAGGPSGTSMLARFCDVEPELTPLLREVAAEEARHGPDAVFAEIVFVPQERVGNILLRPLLREYEIPFMARSGAPRDRQLPISDLTVSVREGRFVLRSRRLDREVRPRLSAAHNYFGQGLSLYRFLCALQHEGTGGGAPGWGTLAQLPRLPRVRLGRTVLLAAQWRLSSEDSRAIADASEAARLEVVAAVRGRLGLPRWVTLEGEAELVIDLESPLCVGLLAHALRSRPAVLKELVGGPGMFPVTGPGGHYVHELLVPLRRREVEPRRPARSPRAVDAVRAFPPGSEWAYLKLYTSPAMADRLLREQLGPFLRAASERGGIDRWFFIRYADPLPHLRLRMHGRARTLTREVVPALWELVEPAVRAGVIHDVQQATYRRELERYGGDAGIGASETVFWADSEAALRILESCETGADSGGLDARWRLTLAGMELLLHDLGLALPERTAVARRLKEGYAREFADGKPLETAISQRARTERRSLERLLEAARNGGEVGDPALDAGIQALRARSQVVRELAPQLRGELLAPDSSMLAGWLHMHANRVLRSGHRRHERVLYDLWWRLLESQLARGKKG